MFQSQRTGKSTVTAKLLVAAAASAFAVTSAFAQDGDSRLSTTSGVVILDSGNTGGALTFTGTVHIRVPVIYVNSSSESAVVGSGNGIIETPTLNVVGGTRFNGSACCTGAVVDAPGPMLDPYGSTVVAAASSMPALAKVTLNGGRHTINPGNYAGGLFIKGGAAVTFSPGVYEMGADFSLTSGSVVGEGVTIVMRAGRFIMGGNSTKSLSAPEEGMYAGIVIAQPASNTSVMSITGGTEMSLAGAIWAPGANVSVTGNSSVETTGPAIGDSLVCKTLSVNGSGVVKLGRPTDHVVPPQINGLFD